MTNKKQMLTEQLGYIFAPPAYKHAPGSPELNVFLREHPTEKHFDPIRVQILVASDDVGVVETLVVELPWPKSESYRACAGRITLTDHKEKEVNMFCFGGSLAISPGKDVVACTLTSPAPIIELTFETSIYTRLAEECEILLAEREAAQAKQKGAYLKRLAAAEPAALYAACLLALQEKFKDFPHKEEFSIAQLTAFIKDEISVLQEQQRWPTAVLTLNDLL